MADDRSQLYIRRPVDEDTESQGTEPFPASGFVPVHGDLLGGCNMNAHEEDHRQKPDQQNDYSRIRTGPVNPAGWTFLPRIHFCATLLSFSERQ